MDNIYKMSIELFIISFAISLSFARAATIYDKEGTKIDFVSSFKVRHFYTKNRLFNGDQSKVKFTLRGITDINEDIKGYLRWEYNIKANNPEEGGTSKAAVTRIGYAGFQFGNFHTLDYGRNYGILNDINGWTGAPVPVFGGMSYNSIDNFMTYRTNNVLTWRITDFAGLAEGFDFALQAQGKNDGGNNSEGNETKDMNQRGASRQNGDGIGASAIYRFDNDVSLGTSYAYSNRTNRQQADGLGCHATGWNSGIKFDDGNIYLAAIYGNVRKMHYIGSVEGFASKARGYELLMQYLFVNGLKPSIGYQNGKFHNVNGRSKKYENFIDLSLTYHFNQNLSIVAEYKVNLLNQSAFTNANRINTDDIIVSMLIYTF